MVALLRWASISQVGLRSGCGCGGLGTSNACSWSLIGAGGSYLLDLALGGCARVTMGLHRSNVLLQVLVLYLLHFSQTFAGRIPTFLRIVARGAVPHAGVTALARALRGLLRMSMRWLV